MGGFIFILVIVIVGLGAIFWIIKNDKGPDSLFSVEKIEPEQILGGSMDAQEPDDPIMPPSPPLERIFSDSALMEDTPDAEPATEKAKSNPLSSIIGKLSALTKNLKVANLKGLKIPNIGGLKSKFGKKKDAVPLSDETGSDLDDIASLKEQLHLNDDLSIMEENIEEPPEPELPKTGTASLTTSPALETPAMQGLSTPGPEETPSSKPGQKTETLNSEAAALAKDLQEKYEKLQALFDEKSAECANTKQLFKNEQQNRNEFEKVKEILETELTESKEKARNIQLKLDEINKENDNYKAKISKMEAKIAELEDSSKVEIASPEPAADEIASEKITPEQTEPALPTEENIQETQEPVVNIPLVEVPQEETIASDVPQENTPIEETVEVIEIPIVESNESSSKKVIAQKQEIPLQETIIEPPTFEPETVEQPPETAEEEPEQPLEIVSFELPEKPAAPEATPEEGTLSSETLPNTDIPLPEPTKEEEVVETEHFGEAPEPLKNQAFTTTTSPMAPQDAYVSNEQDDAKMKVFEDLARHSFDDDNDTSSNSSKPLPDETSEDNSDDGISKKDIFASLDKHFSEEPSDYEDDEETEFLALPPDPFAEPNNDNEEKNT